MSLLNAILITKRVLLILHLRGVHADLQLWKQDAFPSVPNITAGNIRSSKPRHLQSVLLILILRTFLSSAAFFILFFQNSLYLIFLFLSL